MESSPPPPHQKPGRGPACRDHLELGVRPRIDPAREVEDRVSFLVDYLRSTPTTGYVLGISGGQDSTLAGRLCQLAAERLRAEGMAEARFIAMRLPYGAQADEDDARTALRFIRPDACVTVDVRAASDASAAAAAAALSELPGRAGPLRDFVRGNVKARERMIAQYALAGQLNLLVVGTDHAAEAVTGFYTKYGDGGVDLTPERSHQTPGRRTAAPSRRARLHLEQGPHRGPGGRPPRPTGRGGTRRDVRANRRLPRGIGRRSGRRRGPDRAPLPHLTPQAGDAGLPARHLVALTLPYPASRRHLIGSCVPGSRTTAR